MISVVELRRYTLEPGARETLVELFDREFVESQEALGMRILGTFRDLDDFPAGEHELPAGVDRLRPTPRSLLPETESEPG